MKRIIFILIALASLALCASAQDTTASMRYSYADSLKTGTRDTIDVVPANLPDEGFYQISAISDAADTLNVYVCTVDSIGYVKRGCINLLTGSTDQNMITGTSRIDWVINGASHEKKIRFMSPGATNAIKFTIFYRTGELTY